MEFKDKFKPGDIICSDSFHYGKCVVVYSIRVGLRGTFSYICEDFVLQNQRWLAYDSYNWRIATDDDIVNYLDRFVTIDLGNIGPYSVTLTDTGIRLYDGNEYGCTDLEAEDLVALRKIINKYVVTEAELAKDNYYKDHKAWEWEL